MAVHQHLAAARPKTSATQSRAEETRQKLIAAAVRLIADRGYVDVQPKEIARAADLTTGAFYYHFGSKEELFSAIIGEGLPKAATVMDTFFASQSGGLPKFIELTFAVLDTINENQLQWIGYHLSQAIGHLGPAAREEYLERVRGFFTLAAVSIAPAELRDDVTPQQAGELIWMTMSGAQHVSDVVGDRDAAVFERLRMAWRAMLRAIARPDSIADLERLVEQTADRYPIARPPVRPSDAGLRRLLLLSRTTGQDTPAASTAPR